MFKFSPPPSAAAAAWAAAAAARGRCCSKRCLRPGGEGAGEAGSGVGVGVGRLQGMPSSSSKPGTGVGGHENVMQLVPRSGCLKGSVIVSSARAGRAPKVGSTEPSEAQGGRSPPLTAEIIIARWVSMIIEMSSVRRWNPKPWRRVVCGDRGGRRGVRAERAPLS